MESDTNKEHSDPKDKKQKVLFDKRVCFLAACAAGDYEEISKLLSRGAADIDACQEDGMTSLHQVRERSPEPCLYVCMCVCAVYVDSFVYLSF